MSESEKSPRPRRRSSQRRRPKRRGGSSGKKGNPLKWVLIVGASLLLMLFIGLIIARTSLNSWLKGDGFRNWAKKTSATVLKSEVDFASLEWKNSEVYVDGFEARGYEDAGFAKLEIDGLRARFDGVANEAWQIPDTTANRMNLEFSGDREKGDFGRFGSANIADDGKLSTPSWLRKLLPEKVDLGEIQIDAGNVTIKNSTGQETVALRSVRAQIDPDLDSAMWEIGGRSGKLFVAGTPDFNIQQFQLRWQRENLFITDLALNFYNGAHLSGTGDVIFAQPTRLNLELQLENLDIHELLTDEEAKEKFSGFLEGDINIQGVPGSPEGLVQSGTVRIRDGVVTAIPILDTISKYTKKVEFKRLGLNQAKADFIRKGGRIHLTNIEIQSDGLTRIEGEMLIEGERLAGIFQLGVTPGTLRWIPGADRKVFVESRDGFLWTPLKIAGTFDEVDEDLTARLIAAAGEALIEDLPENVIKKAQETVNDPIGTPSNLIDEGRGLLESLIPLIGN
ncbi:MAG: hypothetical protein HKN23_09105 [Verrucomicrobiales bacterium]|nr:hypothetical protein [Verrucomicrobiales bacterium]